MIYVQIAVILLYYCIFLIYYRILFPPLNNNNTFIVLTLLAITAAYVLRDIYKANWINLLIVLIIMVLGIRLSTGMNWLQAVYGGCTSVINAYCFRGIFVVISFFLPFKKEIDYLINVRVYHITTVLALPAALLFLELLRRTLFPNNKLKRFLYNSGQLRIVIVYEIMAIIYLVIILHGRLLSPDIVWYMTVSVGAFLLTLGMMIYAIYHSIRATQLMEYQCNVRMMEQQYKLQLRHYKTYQRYTENFRTFRHDYKYMMLTLKSLIEQKETKKALQFLDSIYNTMEKKVQIHKRYSENVVLDAILQDLANICEENKIHFCTKAFVPRNTKIELLDAVRILLNLSNNAVEACYKVPASQRFIKLVSTTEQGWVSLEVSNSFDGKIKFNDELPVTTKGEKEEHGLGLIIVNDIVRKLGGFVFLDADCMNKIFIIRVHIPQLMNKKEEEPKII